MKASSLPSDTLAKVLAAAGEPAPKRRPGGPRRESPLVEPAVVIEFVLPVRTVSLANSREHWSERARRAKATGHTFFDFTAACGLRGLAIPFRAPLLVTLTRLGGKRLDPDNLAGALKEVQDACARWIGVDDGDERITWVYGQQVGGPVGVRVRAEGRA